MREPWVYRRLMAMLAATMLVHGIVAFLTYVEEDDLRVQGEPYDPNPVR